jgi:hypothetical protein
VFYCDRCARRYGSRRLLAAADRYAGPGPGTTQPSDGWRLWLSRRAGRKSPTVSLYSGRQVPRVSLYTPVVPSTRGARQRIGPVLQPGGHRFVLVSLETWAPLICYRCPARPRESRAALVELAERTVAAGRRDAYV